jgi:hypothetical protein
MPVSGRVQEKIFKCRQKLNIAANKALETTNRIPGLFIFCDTSFYCFNPEGLPCSILSVYAILINNRNTTADFA